MNKLFQQLYVTFMWILCILFYTSPLLTILKLFHIIHLSWTIIIVNWLVVPIMIIIVILGIFWELSQIKNDNKQNKNKLSDER